MMGECGDMEGTRGESGGHVITSVASVLREREGGERRRAGEKGTVAGCSILICVSI